MTGWKSIWGAGLEEGRERGMEGEPPQTRLTVDSKSSRGKEEDGVGVSAAAAAAVVDAAAAGRGEGSGGHRESGKEGM